MGIFFIRIQGANIGNRGSEEVEVSQPNGGFMAGDREN